MTSPESDLNNVLRRLAETIAWCRLRAPDLSPETSLRTPALRPANRELAANQWELFDYDWGSDLDRRIPLDAVAALAGTRATLLRQEDAYDDTLPANLVEGRLLIAVPDDSDVCGLSVFDSKGFIDDLDVPAWDTWVCYLQEPLAAGAPAPYGRDNHTVSYLLCWIPPQFVALVEAGIQVNPVECFFWAAEYEKRHHDTALLRSLEAAGLLR